MTTIGIRGTTIIAGQTIRPLTIDQKKEAKTISLLIFGQMMAANTISLLTIEQKKRTKTISHLTIGQMMAAKKTD